jgi:hypothetical protein
MVDAWLPYGKSEVCVRIPARNFLGSIEPKEKPATQDPRAEIERALKELEETVQTVKVRTCVSEGPWELEEKAG